MALFPLEPQLSKVIIESVKYYIIFLIKRYGCTADMLTIVSMLSV